MKFWHYIIVACCIFNMLAMAWMWPSVEETKLNTEYIIDELDN